MSRRDDLWKIVREQRQAEEWKGWDAARRVLADYYEESGNPLGMFIRVQVALDQWHDTGGPIDHPRGADCFCQVCQLRCLESDLLANHRDAWVHMFRWLIHPVRLAFGYGIST